MSDSDDIVLLLECDGREAGSDAIIIAANDAFCRASGYSDDQLLGCGVAVLFPTGHDAETLMSAMRGAGSLRTELSCSRADGSSFMLGMHLMPAPARKSGLDCFLVLGRDISSLLQARHMQDSIQRLLAKVFASVDAAVAIVNAAGRIVMTNPRMDLLLGHKPNGLVGRLSLELVVPGSRGVVAAAIKRQLEDEADTAYSVPMLRADGSLVNVRITSVIATTGDAKKFRVITLQPEAVGTPPVRSMQVGRIKLVGLDEVRVALGDHWPAAAERAMATAEVVIRRNCGPEDSYSRVDETSFLMCFGKLSEEESAFRAAMIGREIRSRLIGQGEDPESTYVRSVAAMVRFRDQGESGASLTAILLQGLDRQLDRLEQEARQVLSDTLANAACDVALVFGRVPGRVIASQVLIPPRLERQLVSAMAALPQTELQPFDLDELLVGLAARHAVASFAQGQMTPLLVKLSFNVFATRATTERFLATCARIDRRVCARLVLLLSELPEGVPRTRLQDCVNRLRPFCRGVGYEVEQVADLSGIDLSNSFNAVVSLPAAACFDSAPAELRTTFASLQAQHAKVLIRGVGSEKDAGGFRSLGADMLSMKRPLHDLTPHHPSAHIGG